VEELLRCHGPVKVLMRPAVVDQQIDGRPVPAGESVLVDVRAANRDPARLPDPHRMDLTRESVGHLGFGTGIHFCLGAALARLETAETLTRLFARHPDMTLVDETTRWRESMTLHGLTTLIVGR
jgi:cytochrome P450